MELLRFALSASWHFSIESQSPSSLKASGANESTTKAIRFFLRDAHTKRIQWEVLSAQVDYANITNYLAQDSCDA